MRAFVLWSVCSEALAMGHGNGHGQSLRSTAALCAAGQQGEQSCGNAVEAFAVVDLETVAAVGR